MFPLKVRDPVHSEVHPTSGRSLLGWEIFPDPRGFVSFTALIAIAATHLSMAPDRDGYLFGSWSGLFSGTLRGSLLHESFEGYIQACLLAGPIAILYAAIRHLREKADSLLPYLTFVGSGFLALMTCVGIILETL